MPFPTVVADNFFTDPYKIINYSKKLQYDIAPEGNYPGKRSAPLHTINPNLFLHVCTKILSILYPMNYLNIHFTARGAFQKIDMNLYDEAWVHNDANINIFTAIVYLSNHKNCGTSLYHPKDNFYECTVQSHINPNDHYLDPTNLEKRKKAKELCKINNEQYEETIRINSKFNRLILFDANHYHAAHSYIKSNNKKEERLTLIVFFNDIKNINPNDKRLRLPLESNRFHY